MAPTDPGPALSRRTHPVHHGRLVRLEPTGTAHPTLVFPYNPESVTRSRTGKWEPRKRRRDPATIETPQQHRGQFGGTGTSALLAESETIALTLTFDATEPILRGDAGAATDGVLPQLAFLELVSLGREESERQGGGRGRPTPGREIRPIRPDQLLLELGETRWFPCVLTELSITEQRFSPALVPVRATAQLKLTVLEPVENAYNPLVQQTFDHLLSRRKTLAEQLATTTATSSLQGLLGGTGG